MKTTSRNPDSVSSEKNTPEAARSDPDHLHDADRQRQLEMVEPSLDPVMDPRAVGEQAPVATTAGFEQRPVAMDVEVGLLLAGEALAVDGSSRSRSFAPRGSRRLLLLLEAAIAGDDLPRQVLGQAGSVHDLPGRCPRRPRSVTLVESRSSSAA